MLIEVSLDGSSPPIQSRSRRFIGIHTGYRLTDILFPVAQGQRELVIGDRQTGKTQLICASVHSQCFRNGYSPDRKRMLANLSAIGQRVSSSLRSFYNLAYNMIG